MALLSINIFSETLLRNINITAILPVDTRTIDGSRPWKRGDRPFKSLYLLHGIHGCENDWLTGTRIKRWAQERNLAVFMPAGENKFYNHLYSTHDWFDQFIGRELVEMMRAMFPLSEKREDTYIAGLSMGGYGGLCAGLRYPETFSCIGALSPAIIERYPKTDEGIDVVHRRSYMEACFGSEDLLKESDNSVYKLLDDLKKKNAAFPKIYMAMGENDSLKLAGHRFRDYLVSNKYPVDYFETPGGHDWDFWDTHILKFLDWLPLSD